MELADFDRIVDAMPDGDWDRTVRTAKTLPKVVIEEGTSAARDISVFGVSVTTMSRDELFAVVGFLATKIYPAGPHYGAVHRQWKGTWSVSSGQP